MKTTRSLSPADRSVWGTASPERGPRGYTTLKVSSMCGVSLRQLQWWDERSIVRPHILHPHRRYSAADVTKVSIVRALRDKGVPMLLVRRLLPRIKLPNTDRELFLMIAEGRHFITADARRIIQRMKFSVGGAVVVGLSNEYGLRLAQRPANI